MNADATITATRNSLASAECDRVSIERVVDSPWQYNGQRQITVNACVTKGKDIDLAVDGNGYPFVKYHSDSVYRILKSEAGGNLVAGTNYYSYIRNTVDYRLRTVENLATALIEDTEDDWGDVISYRINPTAITSQLPVTNSEGEYHRVFSYQVTNDLRYISAYIDYAGVIKIDLQSGSVKKVLRAPGSSTYHRYIPNVEAISDDGRFVLTGNSAVIIDTEGCGDALTGMFYGDVPLNDGCRSQDFDALIAREVPYSYRLNKAKFIDNGSAVEFLATLQQGESQGTDSIPREITLYSYGYQAPTSKLEYLALGDSYSSGEGDIGNDGLWYKIGTEKEGRCHLSIRSYPYLLREAWNIQDSKMASVACSGALLGQDYTSPQDSYNGQHGETENSSEQEKVSARSSALENYTPGIVPQLEFVKKYRPKVVTITGSGNDAGFADILKYCASDLAEAVAYNYTCEYVEGGPLNQLLNDSIDTQYAKIVELITEVKRASPGVKVYYIGYPSFIGGSHTNCFMSNSGILDGKERDMINDAVKRLNNVIKNAASVGGAQYVDIESALNGGRLCEGSEYVTGLWAAGSLISGDYSQTFHPNSKGHEKIKESIVAKVSNPISGYQPTSQNVITINPTIPTSRARIVHDPNLNGEEMLEITLEPNSTPGSSDIYVAAFSERVDLGSYKSSEDGSLDAKIKIPSSLPGGPHLILLEIYQDGTLLSRIYDFITLTRNVENHRAATSILTQSDPFKISDSPSNEMLSVTKSDNLFEPDLINPNIHSLGSATNDIASNSKDDKHNNNVFIIVTSCILFLCAAIVCIKERQNR